MKGHKNLHLMANGMTGLLSCLLLFSCNNDDYPIESESGKVCENICFGISSDETSITRGISGIRNEDGRTVSHFVLRSEESADTLCVRASVSDCIVSSSLTDEKTMTRGVPVTFLNAFHVSAYWKKDENLQNQFFMDETATDNGNNVWSTDNIYYWPGANHTLQFYAYAPADAGFTAPTTSGSTTLADYIIPSEVALQRDIVVANTMELSGNNNQVVPLQFKHICTAVRFVVGSEIQPGTIKNITLKGVRGSGSYDMANSLWTLGETVADFSQSPNKTTDGNTTEDDEITTAEGTFMMLPQTLVEGASVEIVFHDNMSSQDRTLTASIAGQEWPMGKTVTYKLSISPDYELEFITKPQEQDAHYVIYPITIKADKVPEGGWTLTSNDTENVTFVEKFAADGIKSLVDQGYWLKDNCGTSTLTSSSSGEIQIYAFLKENISEEDRPIVLSLVPTNAPNAVPATFTFKQYCPAWNNGIGVERIQEADYPWGFNWDPSMKITYSMPSGFWSGIIHILFEIFGDHSYVNSTGLAITGTWKVTVDFSKVPKLNQAVSTSDGLTNTWELYNFDGINEASSIMSQLESWGGTPDKTLPSNPSEFAAWACAKKNKYKTNSQSNQGETIYVPVLEQTDMEWYLPAQEEAPLMKDNLSGNYWTSTAIETPGTTAYKYTAGGITSPEKRNNPIHVRAVRRK